MIGALFLGMTFK